MSTKEHLILEFEKRVFEEYYDRIYKCFRMLDDTEIWKAPNSNVPAIGNLVLHLCGNARQWILSGLGSVPDNRNRDQEFIPQTNIRKSDLVFLLENLKTNLRETLNELPAEKLNEIHTIQGFHVSGFSVVIHVLEHFSYHTGQITTLTKLIKNQPTGFYANMNLNQLNSLN